MLIACRFATALRSQRGGLSWENDRRALPHVRGLLRVSNLATHPANGGRANFARVAAVSKALVSAGACLCGRRFRSSHRRRRSLQLLVACRQGSSGISGDGDALGGCSPLAPLGTPFPLEKFEALGMPPSCRFLWWEQTRGPHRRREGTIRSGLHPLELADGWLEVSNEEDYAYAMAERRAVLASQQDLALVGDEASLRAQSELLELVVQHLSARFPSRFSLQGEGGDRCFTSICEGLRWRIADYAEAPLLLVGQLVQEDICLMREEPGQSAVSSPAGLTQDASGTPPPPLHIFAAGVVTESFDPVAKHMLPMMALHEPVPRYAEDLAGAMGRLFASLRRPMWRANFAFAEWRYEDVVATNEDLVQRMYLKVEYETLRRLDEHSNYLVFTIRSHADPLIDLAKTPRACAALASEMRTLPEALLAYKGLESQAAKDTVLRYLDSVAAPVVAGKA